MHRAYVWTWAVLLAACGGKAVVDGNPGGLGGAGGGGGTGSGLTTTTTSSFLTTTSWTSGGYPALEASYGSVEVGIDCMPEVPADPVWAQIEINYDNTAGTAPVVAAIGPSSLTFGNYPDELAWSFELDPPSSGVVMPGESVLVVHQKVPGSGTGGASGGPCAFCGPGHGSVMVNVDTDGGDPDTGWVAIISGFNYGCAY